MPNRCTRQHNTTELAALPDGRRQGEMFGFPPPLSTAASDLPLYLFTSPARFLCQTMNAKDTVPSLKLSAWTGVTQRQRGLPHPRLQEPTLSRCGECFTFADHVGRKKKSSAKFRFVLARRIPFRRDRERQTVRQALPLSHAGTSHGLPRRAGWQTRWGGKLREMTERGD